ncbi:MAG: hypothetical protein GYB65_02045 [Chloroflexi bacterium]|nr:hypothetical protein [Chloroflexota bacterium]
MRDWSMRIWGISRLYFTWIVLAAVIAAIALGSRMANDSTPIYRWADLRAYTTVPAFTPVDVLITTRHRALIVPAATDDAVLTYTALEPGDEDRPLLPYPNIEMIRWQAAAAQGELLHLVWLTPEHTLFSAYISAEGETLRVNELAGDVRADFLVLPYGTGSLRLIWVDTHDSSLMTRCIDPGGRPEPLYSNQQLLPQAHFAAGAMGTDGRLHLAWLQAQTAQDWTLWYQAGDAGDLDIQTARVVDTLLLEPGETLSEVHLGLDTTHAYLFWTTQSSDQPDISRVSLATFPLGAPDEITFTELALPRVVDPVSLVTLDPVPYGPVVPLGDRADDPAAMRWVIPVPGQASILPLTLAQRTTDGWRPAVVYFQAGQALGFQVITALPANAGPATPVRDPAGDLVLAWPVLQGTDVGLYIASTAGAGLVEVAPEAGENDRDTITARRALAWVPVGLVWLVVPGCIILLSPHNRWAFPLAVMIYSSTKLVWPATLFEHIPNLLDDAGISVGVAVLLIALIGGGLASLAQYFRRPIWQGWLLYALPDVVITWVVFGENVG